MSSPKPTQNKSVWQYTSPTDNVLSPVSMKLKGIRKGAVSNVSRLDAPSMREITQNNLRFAAMMTSQSTRLSMINNQLEPVPSWIKRSAEQPAQPSTQISTITSTKPAPQAQTIKSPTVGGRLALAPKINTPSSQQILKSPPHLVRTGSNGLLPLDTTNKENVVDV